MRRHVLLLATAALAGCATSSSSSSDDRPRRAGDEDDESPVRSVRARGVTGDDFADAGDWDRAVAAYESELAAHPGDAAATEKLRTARRLAGQRHAENAVRAHEHGDDVTAAAELARAKRFAPDASVVQRVEQRIGSRVQAAERADKLKAQAREVLETDPARARDLLAEARSSAPHDDEIVSLLRRATLATEAESAAARADALWQAGDRLRAMDELRTATFDGKPVPASFLLRQRMSQDLLAESMSKDVKSLRAAWTLAREAQLPETTIDTLRERLVDRLMALAGDADAKGSPALAALYEIEAQRTGARVETKAADRVRAGAAIRVVVRPFETKADAPVDGATVARALVDRIAADAAHGSMVLRVEQADGGSGAANLDVGGTVLSHRISQSRGTTETKTVRYASGTRDIVRTADEDVAKKLEASTARLDAARKSLDEKEAEYRKWVEMPYTVSPAGAGPRATPENPVYQKNMAKARVAAEAERQKYATVAAEEKTLRAELIRQTQTTKETIWADAEVEVTTRTKTAQLTARVRVRAGEAVLVDEEMTASADHKETTSPANLEARVPADPDDTPTDAEMAARAADALAGIAAGRVRAAAERAAEPVLAHARAKQRDGGTAAAAEAYALYLLSTPETASPGRAEAARAVAALTGLTTVLRTGWDGEDRR